MTKALIGSACGLLLIVSGCGSSKSGERKTACTQAATAMYRYHSAGQAVGSLVSDKAGIKRVIADAAVFREKLSKLEPLTSDTQRKQLRELAGSLVQHEQLLAALAANNLKLARKLATGNFENGLDAGQAHFRAVCNVPREPKAPVKP